MTIKALKHAVRSRAPLRIGLAGGGTDIYEFYSLHGGAVLNATINKYAYAELSPRNSDFLAASLDSGIERLITERTLANEVPGQNLLHFATYSRIMRDYNDGTFVPCQLKTYCDAPIGSGLGSSSTLVVAMVKAFSEALNLGLDDYEIAELSYIIERIDCGLVGGRQDQFAATFGGFNFIEFEKDRTIVNPLRIKNWFKCELESSFLLHFTGLSRSSAEVIQDQICASTDPAKNRFSSLMKLKQESVKMKESVLKCDRDGIRSSLQLGWANKIKTSNKVSSPEIDTLISYGLENGAEAAKISGAGGGGFILFMCNPSHTIQLKHKLLPYSKETFFCTFSDHGVQAWKV